MKILKCFLLSLFWVSLGHSAELGGRVEAFTLDSAALRGNLSGDDPARSVSVYLPPGYDAQPDKRFPVLYFLHGFTDSDAQWFGRESHWIHLNEILDRIYEAGGAKEMIVVMPNAYNRFRGSMYGSSETVGDWEHFIARELVEFIDERFRTVANRAGRGLAGHSMGGYGAIRIGMKNPEVYAALYLLSPCCMELLDFEPNDPLFERLTSVESDADIAELNFFEIATLASAAAWAPNPENPPLYLDLPVQDGAINPKIAAKFAANATLVVVDQYIPALRQFEALAMDVGDEDSGIALATAELSAVLNAYGIDHLYEEYQGDHLNRIAERIRHQVLPFFTKHLQFAE